jgi:hypothetical protein
MSSETQVVFPPFANQIDLDQRMAEIARAGLQQRLLLLIGAGFPKDARGYPTGSELASILVRETYRCTQQEADAVAQKYELAAISQQFVEKTTDKRPQLISRVKQELSRPPATKSQPERDLATVASLCRLCRVFTTNFDSTIEDALDARAKTVQPTVASIREFEEDAAGRDVTGVFHLHGDLTEPRITEDDLRTPRSLFFELLRQDLLTHVLVMVGYSFRDDAIRQIYNEVYDLLKAVGQERRNYIVTPVHGQLDYELAVRLWSARGDIVVIPLRAGEFLRCLVTHLEECRYEDIVKAIADHQGKTAMQINEQLRPLKHQFAHLTPSELAEAIQQFIKLRDL